MPPAGDWPPAGKASAVAHDGSTSATEADREFIQFYHRRVAWLSLRRHEKAIQDADHTIALMDFVRRHVQDEDYISSHEHFAWSVVSSHRGPSPWHSSGIVPTRRSTPCATGSSGLRSISVHGGKEHDADRVAESRARRPTAPLRAGIRKKFALEKTLREQLDEAVAKEDYEQAARFAIRFGPRSEHGDRPGWLGRAIETRCECGPIETGISVNAEARQSTNRPRRSVLQCTPGEGRLNRPADESERRN